MMCGEMDYASGEMMNREEIVLSARAVVDAAIVCKRELGYQVHDELRKNLIQAVIDDPLFTAELFRSGRLLIQ